jgi:hypothetical protein
MQTHYFGTFWTKIYEGETRSATTYETFVTWCSEHGRYEASNNNYPQLMMQLESGMLNKADWTDTMIRLQDGRSIDPSNFQGSRGRGNGNPFALRHEHNAGCVNMLCLIWETHIDNCHC